jgi:tetratricopeptide (TPR) repeat protein
MKKINIFLIALLTTGLVSCKDFLDVAPTNSNNTDIAIQTPADAQVMVNGLMRSMSSVNYYGRNFIMYGDAKGGDLTIFSQGRGLDQLYTFNHSQTTNNNGTFWSHIYNGIIKTNNLLEGIDKLEPNVAFNTYKGQALTARAMMYFDLVRLYGKSYDDDKTSFGVPNITTTLPFDARPLRATVDENYQQILADLIAAAPLLPKTPLKGYINYYANQAMQARVYLYMKDYPNALKAAEEVMTNTNLILYSNANWVDSWKTQFGSESIFELGIFPSEGDLATGSLGFYLRRRGHNVGAVSGWFMASTDFINRLNQDPADIRKGIMSFDESSATRLGSLYKYSGSPVLVNNNFVGDGKSTATAVNIKVIRLSEIYLIAAEAALNIDKAKAVTYLNAIRKRSPNLAPATEATITLDMIMDERSKELLGEGHRFFDMIRLNKSITFNDEFGGITVPHRAKTINRSFYKTRLPIPQDEINANPGLAAQQNDGY